MLKYVIRLDFTSFPQGGVLMTFCKVRAKGLKIGSLSTGTKNCITDVIGVQTGHSTIKEGESCTGVTAILPHSGDLFQHKVAAASHVLNGFTKCIGTLQIDELGNIETPIMLTNTLNVGKVADGTIDYMLESSHNKYRINSINPVVLECNDGYLNDINTRTVNTEDVLSAIKTANDDITHEGCIGAGKGMISFGYKSGIGCSSRVITDEKTGLTYTLGALVLSNFGKREQFQIQGNYVEKLLNNANNSEEKQWDFRNVRLNDEPNLPDSNGSIIIILATDAPLENRQLNRLAKRAPLGLSKLGGYASHGSGEVVVAFSTTNIYPHVSSDNKSSVKKYAENILIDHPSLMDKLFQGVVEAIEESVLNSINCSETTTGYQGRVVEKLPFDKVIHRIVNNLCG